MNRGTDWGVPFCSQFSTQKFNFCIKIPPKNLFYKILRLSFQPKKRDGTAIFVSHEWSLGHFLIFLAKKGKKLSTLPRICQRECNNSSL